MVKLSIVFAAFLGVLYSESTFSQSVRDNSEKSSSDYIGFYQKYISEVRGQQCPMYPSCSNYALSAFKETNFVKALILSSDRLVRCGHDLNDSYALTMQPTGLKYLDYPADNNSPKSLIYASTRYYYAYSNPIHSDSSITFIKSLINNGYYQQALLEIKRTEFTKPFSAEVFINELVCLRATGEYEKAIFEYETKCPSNCKNDSEILFQLAAINYKLYNYDKALGLVQTALNNNEDPYEKTKLIELQGLLYANKYEWKNARNSFQNLSGLPFDPSTREATLNYLKNADHLPHKSPALASVLSAIPGAGYAYIGHRQTAVSSFLLNSVLAYATYGNIKNHNYGMATLTGIFSASFYIANIYGALQSARRFNEQQKKNIVNKLEYKSNLNL